MYKTIEAVTGGVAGGVTRGITTSGGGDGGAAGGVGAAGVGGGGASDGGGGGGVDELGEVDARHARSEVNGSTEGDLFTNQAPPPEASIDVGVGSGRTRSEVLVRFRNFSI